jgi:hypothetical protein
MLMSQKINLTDFFAYHSVWRAVDSGLGTLDPWLPRD